MGVCFSKTPPTIHEQIARSIKNCDAKDYYNISEEIGSGSMGSVYVCTPKPNRIELASSIHGKNSKGRDVETYALKVMNVSGLQSKFGVSPSEIKNEVSLLKQLDHPFIVRLIETFERDQKLIYIIMERCFGGDLFCRAPYSEKEAARITTQILSAVGYMHSNNIIHRDLKFENIMFESNDIDSPIKIIDFGLARKHSKRNQFVTGFGGTVYTMAPEVLENVPYTDKADIWSVGIIVYMLLASDMPFQCADRKKSFSVRRKVTIEKILKEKVMFSQKCWAKVSMNAQRVILSMCEKNPSKRVSAYKALQSMWFRDLDNLSNDFHDDNDWLEKISNGINDFSKANALKRVGALILAHRMPNIPELTRIRKTFQMLDIEQDGIITRKEFKASMSSFYTEKVLDEMYDKVDLDKNGIHYTEFIAATMETIIQFEEDKIRDAFDVLDKSNSGTVTRAEIRTMIGEKDFDQLNDDIPEEISFADFLPLFSTKKRYEAKSAAGQSLVV